MKDHYGAQVTSILGKHQIKLANTGLQSLPSLSQLPPQMSAEMS